MLWLETDDDYAKAPTQKCMPYRSIYKTASLLMLKVAIN